MTANSVAFLDMKVMSREVADELDAVWTEMAASSSFIGGALVDGFEATWASYCGTEHAVGVANGTDAMELVLRALGIGHGDEVMVPANIFVATGRVVRPAPRLGRGRGPRTLLVTPETLEEVITQRRRR